MHSGGMPTDHFAALGMPRRPWLDAETLKARFHQLTATGHPDLGGDEQSFAAVNAAYSILRQPALRLRHLLELEAPEAMAGASNPVPAALANRFMDIATLRRAVDAFVQQQSGAGSPLARALLASERFAVRRDVEKALADMETVRRRCLDALQLDDERWESLKDEVIPRLAELQQELTYLEKWMGQLREALLEL
jgi:curved DNA-binding protein CbpA